MFKIHYTKDWVEKTQTENSFTKVKMSYRVLKTKYEDVWVEEDWEFIDESEL